MEQLGLTFLSTDQPDHRQCIPVTSSDPVVVLAKTDPIITTRILPTSREVSFAILEPYEIRQIADEHGPFLHIRLSVGPVEGDIAAAPVSAVWVRSSTDPDAVYLSGGFCTWHWRRDGGTWSFDDTNTLCVIS